MAETNWGGILGTVIVAGVALNMVDRVWNKKYYRQPKRRTAITPKRQNSYLNRRSIFE